MNVIEFQKRKSAKTPITMLTCYDYSMAKILAASQVDAILVGDSVAMVSHGHGTTIGASLDMISTHVTAVRRGCPKHFLVADMPFMSYRKGHHAAMLGVEALMRAGGSAVKMEGVIDANIIRSSIDAGAPVMGHLGLTPQSYHVMGGYKVQGRSKGAAQTLLDQAKFLEDSGVFALVLECVPIQVANEITRALSIPTIGIGAGSGTDGQILVTHDMLGLNPQTNPRFVRTYMQGSEVLQNAINQYCQDVNQRQFPNKQESFDESF